MIAALKRRDFITLLGGAASAWPLAARAQQGERMRRIGVLMNFAVDDPEAQSRNAGFLQGLSELGWTVGRNLRIDYRWGAGDTDRHRQYAAELLALAPDVILANSSAALSSLLQATRTVPIVFTTVADPVGAGYVDSLARPGGNATGFLLWDYSIAAKWLELLKEIAPHVTRAMVFRQSAIAAGPGQFGVIQAAAPSLGVDLRVADVRDAREIERAVTTFAQGSNGGLIVTGSPGALSHRTLIVALAARHRLPAVYSSRVFAVDGGLISYGPDSVDQLRRAAGYVDRILKGEKPADLPVQAPTKYELVINSKTAKAAGIDIPPTLLARADEVIE
jgi:putative tryptophan/tyrosine transport system substrate-binding protein